MNKLIRKKKQDERQENKIKYKWQLNMSVGGQFTSNQGINCKLTYTKIVIHNNRLARNLIFSQKQILVKSQATENFLFFLFSFFFFVANCLCASPL